MFSIFIGIVVVAATALVAVPPALYGTLPTPSAILAAGFAAGGLICIGLGTIAEAVESRE